jgi:hypothetical protein
MFLVVRYLESNYQTNAEDNHRDNKQSLITVDTNLYFKTNFIFNRELIGVSVPSLFLQH